MREINILNGCICFSLFRFIYIAKLSNNKTINTCQYKILYVSLQNKKEIKLIGINNINNNRIYYERYYRKIFKLFKRNR